MTRRSEPVLSQRALNRALLARQHLLQRTKVSAGGEIEHLIAMQAQVPSSPYFGLWTRLGGFQPLELATLIETRRAVRLGLLRNTLHLVTARDCFELRPLFQTALARTLHGSPFGRHVTGIETPLLLAEATKHMREKPRTLTELATLLHKRWPDRDRTSLAYAIRHLEWLIQVPPRGVWGKGGQPTWTTAELWLGRPRGRQPSLQRLIIRYLRAFGPASVADMSAWSGLTALRLAFEKLRPKLRTFRDERGRELFDVPDAPLPDPDIPAPPRFLPEYDNVVLGHEDRTRVIAFDHRYVVGGGMFLVDGFVSGTWKISNRKGHARLTVSAFKLLKKSDRAALAEEGERLLSFAAAEATTRDLEFVVAAPRSSWIR